MDPLQVASRDGKSEAFNSYSSLQGIPKEYQGMPRANGIYWPWPFHIFFFPGVRVLYNDKKFFALVHLKITVILKVTEREGEGV